MSSKELAEIKALLISEKIDPNHVFELTCPESELENTKTEIRKKANGQCYFFTKPEKQMIHLIALVNIDIKLLTEKSKVADLLQPTELKKSSFDPKLISFFKK